MGFNLRRIFLELGKSSILFFLFLNSTFAAPPLANLTLTFQNELLEDSSDSHLILEARKYQFVFVAGFTNEMMRPGLIPGMEHKDLKIFGLDSKAGYFEDNRRALRRELLVPESHLSYIFPNSLLGTSDNANLIAEDFKKISLSTGRPLFIIAHSKGATETLLAVFRHPEFFISNSKIIARVVLCNGAIQGSPLSDLLTQRTELILKDPLGYARVLLGAGSINQIFLAKWPNELARHWAGLNSLTLKYAKPLVKKEYEYFSQRIINMRQDNFKISPSEISKHIFYVRSYDGSQSLDLGNNSIQGWLWLYAHGGGISKIRLPAYLLLNASVRYNGFGHENDTLNDGMVFVSDQSFPGFGKILATLPDSDHGALVNGNQFGLTNKDGNYRRAFTRALLRQLIY